MRKRSCHEIGVEFRDDPEALQIWRAAGADVQVNGCASHAACAAS